MTDNVIIEKERRCIIYLDNEVFHCVFVLGLVWSDNSLEHLFFCLFFDLLDAFISLFHPQESSLIDLSGPLDVEIHV